MKILIITVMILVSFVANSSPSEDDEIIMSIPDFCYSTYETTELMDLALAGNTIHKKTISNVTKHFISKRDFVFTDRLYAKNGQSIFRLVYIVKPVFEDDDAIRMCSYAQAYHLNKALGGSLVEINLNDLFFIDSYEPK